MPTSGPKRREGSRPRDPSFSKPHTMDNRGAKYGSRLENILAAREDARPPRDGRLSTNQPPTGNRARTDKTSEGSSQCGIWPVSNKCSPIFPGNERHSCQRRIWS
jgi:hypothetical protein